jgi:hypothetical protein
MTYLFSIPKKCRTTPDNIKSWENLFCGEIDDHHCCGVCVQNLFFVRALLGFKDSDNMTLSRLQLSICHRKCVLFKEATYCDVAISIFSSTSQTS